MSVSILLGPAYGADRTVGALSDPSQVYFAVPGSPWVPNFSHDQWIKSPYHVVESVKDGNWSDPTLWTGPIDATAVVRIKHAVQLNIDTEIKVAAVYPGGHLRFATNRSTTMQVTDVLVFPNGTLEIGSETQPVDPSANASLVFTDSAINTTDSNAPFYDPGQDGNGMIVLGTLRIHGAIKSPTFARFAQEPLAGQSSFSLAESVDGWKAGDRVVIPDTRQLPETLIWDKYIPQWEDRTLSGAGGTSLSLSSPLSFDHKGARNGDGVVEFLPHVADLSRNVILRSANPQGTRGYVLATNRADVDIRYALFQDMGRTTNNQLDDTTYDANGNPTKIGSNPNGRHPLHLRHLFGPLNPSNTGYQFKVIGNAFADSAKWPITVTDSHYGLIQNNVIYRADGAGIVTANENESFNNIEHNFVMATKGFGTSRIETGQNGSNFYSAGFNNRWRYNVGADAWGTSQGIVSACNFELHHYAAPCICARIPLFRGANTFDGTEGIDYERHDMGLEVPILEFTGNEGYGATSTGLTIWNSGYYHVPPGGKAESVIKDARFWHQYEEAFFAYPYNHTTFDGLVVRGDPTINNPMLPAGVVSGDYYAGQITIRNANIQGLRRPAVGLSCNRAGTFVIENSYFRNLGADIELTTQRTPGTGDQILPTQTIIKNDKFDPWPNLPLLSIAMNYDTNPGGTNYLQRDLVYVADYNQVSGQNFQVFYTQQNPFYGPVPEENDTPGSGSHTVGAPIGDVNMTNQQLVTKYPNGASVQGWLYNPVAIGGALAPCQDQACSNALKMPEISGLVFPGVLPPGLRLVTPQPNEIVGGTLVHLSFERWGDPTNVGGARLKMDDRPEISDSQLQAVYDINNVSFGAHKVTGYLIDKNQNKIPGTDVFVDFTTIESQAPQALSQTRITPINTAFTGILLGNDATNKPLVFSLVTFPAHGTVTLNASKGTYVYTPDSGYLGQDSFTFKVNNGTDDSSPAPVLVTIEASKLVPGGDIPSSDRFVVNRSAGMMAYFGGRDVRVTIFDRFGRFVKSLEGDNGLFWDGAGLPSGVYIYRKISDDEKARRGKIVILK